MSEDQPKRTALAQQVAQARAELGALYDHLEEPGLHGVQVTEQWDGLVMLRHVWAWHDYMLRCLDDWNGPRDWAGPRPTGDTLSVQNEAMVRAWEALGRTELLARLRAAYDRYDALLADASDAELAEPGRGPWGRTVTRLEVIGVVEHDLEHFAQVRAAFQSASPS